MPQNYAYLRVSDKNRQDNETQRDSITRYANENGIIINRWIEESVSGSKTNMADREISTLVATLNKNDKLLCTEVSRLGRDKPFSVLGLINDIAEIHQAELHLTYTSQVIKLSNVEDPEILFGVVGASYVARQEAVKRAERAKAACERRTTSGLTNGRQKGLLVASKLDRHENYIMRAINDKESKTSIAEKLQSSRITLLRWLKSRDNIHSIADHHKVDKTLSLTEIKKQINERLKS